MADRLHSGNGTVVGYHYTSPQAYRSMESGWNYGKKGLLPIKRFLRLRWGLKLPEEAHDGVIDGLLEPEPESWLHNPDYPHVWNYLMGDILREKDVMLLSFDIMPEDRAYVVERGHMEDMFYQEAKTGRGPSKAVEEDAYRKYWESRVPALEYRGGYSLPQLNIWGTIGFERLRVEWTKPERGVWQRILDEDL